MKYKQGHGQSQNMLTKRLTYWIRTARLVDLLSHDQNSGEK